MEQFHYFNFTDQETPFKIIEEIIEFSENWSNPEIRLERIVFSKLSTAKQFIESYYKIKPKKKSNKIQTPSIICSLDSVYEINNILEMIDCTRKIKTEILCEQFTNLEDDLQYFIQDKLPELIPKIDPTFSLIQNEYEIKFSHLLGKKRKRISKKPPVYFQKLIKKYSTELIPLKLGATYYGNKVFRSITNLFLAQFLAGKEIHSLKAILPNFPMKAYDLQEKKGEGFEFRFSSHFSLENFSNFVEDIREIFESSKGNLRMLRLSYYFDSWSNGLDFKSAGMDRFFFSFNDLEFAFAQKNFEIFKSLKSNRSSSSIYFQLTPSISENDFRIELLNKYFKLPIFLK